MAPEEKVKWESSNEKWILMSLGTTTIKLNWGYDIFINTFIATTNSVEFWNREYRVVNHVLQQQKWIIEIRENWRFKFQSTNLNTMN